MNPIKLAFYVLFTIIFCGFLSGNSASAVAADMYTVDNVLVDASGDNATEARSTAISEGQVQAFSLLMQKFNAGTVTVPPETIDRLVQGFQVSDEKIASNHYQAVMSVSFSPAAVRGVLQQYKASGVPMAVPAMLVLPVFKQAGNVVLWEDNPWHDALAAVISGGQNSAYKLPLGDLDDVGYLDARNAMAVGFQQLNALAAKYEVQKIMLIQAEQVVDPATGKQVLEMRVATLDAAEKAEQVLTVEAAPNENLDALLKRGAQMLIMPPKAAPAPAAVQGTQFKVNATFSTLQEWNKIRVALKPEGKIQKMDIRQLSSQDAQLEVVFQGDSAALMQLLKQKALSARQEGNVLEVRVGVKE